MTGGKFKHVRGALESSVKRAGLPDVTWHMFRHTFATRLILNGTDIVTVKDLLGHADIHTTMRYAHSNDDAKRRAVNKLAKGANDNRKPTPPANEASVKRDKNVTVKRYGAKRRYNGVT
jgi:integrase